MSPYRTIAVLSVTGIAMALGGCSYDYWQQTDRVGYHAGDAVKANLESETINPQNPTLFKTTGLGKDGNVVQAADGGGTTSP